MPRGGHNRKSLAERIADGTIRPDRLDAALLPQAVTEWPRVPASFLPDEQECWRRLGTALVAAGTAAKADLLYCEMVSRAMAATDKALADPTVSAATKNQCLKAMREHFTALGLTPAARRAVPTLPTEKDKEQDVDPVAGL